MDNEAVVNLLNSDLQDEHAAIIQYLQHAYAVGEGEIACEIEAIARDEMRHFDWLAETIIDLGGKPSLERGAMQPDGTLLTAWMQNDITLENNAIEQYEKHLKDIEDENIQRLIRRILSDEQAHRRKFSQFAAKVKKDKLKDKRGERDDASARTMNRGIEHEYTVILQYLFHSYMASDDETRHQLEDQAINEMQHLGWLAEELVSSGGTPLLEHHNVDHSTEIKKALRADIRIEKEVAHDYDRAAMETDDARLRELFQRIRDNELYHLDVFQSLLNRQKEDKS